MLPVTGVSESLLNVQWMKTLLPAFKEDCDATPACKSDGWSVLVALG